MKLDVLDKERHIDPWRKKFKEYDKDGSGILDQNDIACMQADRERELRERELFLSMKTPGKGSMKSPASSKSS